MDKEHKKQYDIDYQATQTRRFVLNINRKTRPRLLAHLESQPNLTKYLMHLVEEDMHRQSIETD